MSQVVLSTMHLLHGALACTEVFQSPRHPFEWPDHVAIGTSLAAAAAAATATALAILLTIMMPFSKRSRAPDMVLLMQTPVLPSTLLSLCPITLSPFASPSELHWENRESQNLPRMLVALLLCVCNANACSFLCGNFLKVKVMYRVLL